MTTTERHSELPTGVEPAQLFKRVLVGVDGSPAGIEAARQAALLTDPDGSLTLLGAWKNPSEPIGVVGPTFVNDAERSSRTGHRCSRCRGGGDRSSH